MSIRRLCLSMKNVALSPNVTYSTFKSKASIQNIYPNSENIKPFEPPKSKNGEFTGYIPIKELKITHVASSGPGGQHVNRINTKVDIRFHIESATWLSESTKKKLLEKYPTRVNKDGYFIVRSEKTRSAIINQADALSYIREIIYELESDEPKIDPEAEERKLKNLQKAARQRLIFKQMRSLKKANRNISF